MIDRAVSIAGMQNNPRTMRRTHHSTDPHGLVSAPVSVTGRSSGRWSVDHPWPFRHPL